MSENSNTSKNSTFFQTIKFTLFSISAGVIQISCFALFNDVLHLEFWVSDLLSLVLSVLWNFTLNRKFTFKSAANVPVAMFKVFCYYLVFTPITTWVGHIAVSAGLDEYIFEGLKLISNFITEFLFCKFVVYRGKENTLVKK